MTTEPITLPHHPAKCEGCGVYYGTLSGLAQHECADAPSWVSCEAINALAAFSPKTEAEARLLLSMWGRRSELNEEDINYVVTEIVK